MARRCASAQRRRGSALRSLLLAGTMHEAVRASLSDGELRPHPRFVMVRLIADEQVVARHQSNCERTRLPGRQIRYLTQIVDLLLDHPGVVGIVRQGCAVGL